MTAHYGEKLDVEILALLREIRDLLANQDRPKLTLRPDHLFRDATEIQHFTDVLQSQDHDASAPARNDLYQSDLDPGREEKPMIVAGLGADLQPVGLMLQRAGDALAQGRDVLVLTEPDLVAAVLQLLGHGADAKSSATSPSAESRQP